jgi:hypothetical protein
MQKKAEGNFPLDKQDGIYLNNLPSETRGFRGGPLKRGVLMGGGEREFMNALLETSGFMGSVRESGPDGGKLHPY